MHRVPVSVRMVAILAGLAPLTLFPAVEASPVQSVPPVLAEADPGTTLAVTPLVDGRPGLFVRDHQADGAAGGWRLVAVDAHAPYEFHAVAVSSPDRGAGLIFRAAEKKGPEFRGMCEGRQSWKTNEDTGVQSVSFRNQTSNPLKTASAEIRFKFEEYYCEYSNAGTVDAWLKTERSDQTLFVRANILNQHKNYETAISQIKWSTHGDSGSWQDGQRWERVWDWGMPYWFKAVMKSLWQEDDPSYTAAGNREWPSGDDFFPIGYRCGPTGPHPVRGCEADRYDWGKPK
jgi:hypothetical protein